MGSAGEHLVGKLVGVIGFDRKMAGQDTAHRFNLPAQGVAGLPLPYAGGDLVGVCLQGFLGNFQVDAPVRQNPDFVFEQGDEEKHPGVVAGGVELLFVKGAERPLCHPAFLPGFGDEQPEERGAEFGQAAHKGGAAQQKGQKVSEAVGQKKVGDDEGYQAADAEARQHPCLGVGVAAVHHHGDNLAGGFFLHPGNGRGDPLFFRLCKKSLCAHHLPAPRGAAASEPTAAEAAETSATAAAKAAASHIQSSPPSGIGKEDWKQQPQQGAARDKEEQDQPAQGRRDPEGGEQRQERRPGEGACRFAQPSEKADQDGKENEVVEQGGLAAGGARSPARTAGGLEFAPGGADDRGNSGGKPLVKLARLEARRYDLINDATGKEIGQHPFQPPAHLDADLAVALADQEQDPVVLALLADLPGLHRADAEIFQRVAFQGGDGQHRDLGGVGLLKGQERLFQPLTLSRRDHPGQIGDISLVLRNLQRLGWCGSNNKKKAEAEKTEEPLRHASPMCGMPPKVRHGLELYRRGLGRALFRLESLAARQLEHELVGQVVGEGADGGVEDPHCLVVPNPGHVDPVFRAFELVLEIEEVLIGLEVGIALNHHHQTGEGGGKASLRFLEFGKGLGVIDHFGPGLDGADLGPRLGYGGEGFFLVGRVGLYRFHQIGDEICPPLVGGFHIAPGRDHGLVVLLDGVVAATAQAQGEKRYTDKYEESLHGGSPYNGLGKS